MTITKMSEKQTKIFGYAASKDKEYNKLTYSGAIRAGKSKFGLWGFTEYILQHVQDNEKYHFAVLGVSDSAIEENIWDYITEYLDMRNVPYMAIKGKIKIGKNITITRYGANNKASFKKFQGATLKGVLIDEAAILDDYALQVAEQRCLTYKGNYKVIHCTNPEGSESSSYYKKYVTGGVYKYLHITILDNPIFDKEDLEDFKKIYDEVTYNRKILGKWVVADGAVYKRLPKIIEHEALKDIHFDYIVAGVDEGRVDAIVCEVTGVKGDDYYILDEYYYKKNNPDVLEARNELREFIIEQDNTWSYEIDFTIYFETNPGFLYNMFCNDITEELLYINIKKVNKKKEDHKSATAIQERIDVTNFLIYNDHLFMSSKIEYLKSSFANAIYSKNGVRLDDGTYEVDPLDAFEYGIKVDIKGIIKNMYDLEEIKKRRGA